MAKINFRIVGVYLGNARNALLTLDIGPSKDLQNHSVSDVCFEVQKFVRAGNYRSKTDSSLILVDDFQYLPTPFGDLDKISVNWVQSPISSMGPLQPGTYMLADNSFTDNNPYSVFQYYHFDAAFQQLNRDGKFVPFTQPLTDPLKDGDTIIIRQVNILKGPNVNPKALNAIIKNKG